MTTPKKHWRVQSIDEMNRFLVNPLAAHFGLKKKPAHWLFCKVLQIFMSKHRDLVEGIVNFVYGELAENIPPGTPVSGAKEYKNMGYDLEGLKVDNLCQLQQMNLVKDVLDPYAYVLNKQSIGITDARSIMKTVVFFLLVQDFAGFNEELRNYVLFIASKH